MADTELIVEYLPTVDQQEAYNWWMQQPAGERRTKDIERKFKISNIQAQRWLKEFRKRHQKVMRAQTTMTIATKVDEYHQVRQIAEDNLIQLGSQLQTAQRQKIEDDGQLSVDDVAKFTKANQMLLEAIERATGMDVAKKQAAKQDPSESIPERQEPDFLQAIRAEIESESSENPSENPEQLAANTDTKRIEQD